MPARSSLPDDVNYDEVQSCRISGLSGSGSPERDLEEKTPQDLIRPSDTPSNIVDPVN